MTIRVIFGKNGFYHPSYGRLGRGGNKGVIYELPDEFAEKEKHTVELWDHGTTPPKKTGEREVTRLKYLPRTATILDDEAFKAIEEDAKDNNEDPPRPVRPRPAQGEEGKLPGKKREVKAQSAVERTTGTPARRKAAS